MSTNEQGVPGKLDSPAIGLDAIWERDAPRSEDRSQIATRIAPDARHATTAAAATSTEVDGRIVDDSAVERLRNLGCRTEV